MSVKCSCEPYGTTIGQVVARWLPGTVVVPGRKTISALFENRGEFRLLGKPPGARSVENLMNQMRNLLTVCDDADISHCIDLYREPDDDLPPDDWPYTRIGSLVYQAKYKHDKRAAIRLGERIIEVVKEHPGLSRAEVVCAMPTSGSGKHFDSPAVWRGMVSKELGLPAFDLSRTRSVVQQKTIQSTEERARNQENSMDCAEIAGHSVLVLDDLYMSGQTITEAVRALRARGASAVFALCAVKTATGTQGGTHSLMQSKEPGAG